MIYVLNGIMSQIETRKKVSMYSYEAKTKTQNKI